MRLNTLAAAFLAAMFLLALAGCGRSKTQTEAPPATTTDANKTGPQSDDDKANAGLEDTNLGSISIARDNGLPVITYTVGQFGELKPGEWPALIVFITRAGGPVLDEGIVRAKDLQWDASQTVLEVVANRTRRIAYPVKHPGVVCESRSRRIIRPGRIPIHHRR